MSNVTQYCVTCDALDFQQVIDFKGCVAVTFVTYLFIKIIEIIIGDWGFSLSFLILKVLPKLRSHRSQGHKWGSRP